jgi:dUTP pyrophosphatase
MSGCGCKKKVTVKFKKLRPDAVIPQYKTAGAAGFDLASAEDLIIHPGETVLVKTGLAVEIPPGYEMQVRPRSGVSLKTPLINKNTIGTVDSDYRGEIGVVLHNLVLEGDGPEVGRPWPIMKGDRIAQGVIKAVPEVEIVEAMFLSETERGAGGFGSTGV